MRKHDPHEQIRLLVTGGRDFNDERMVATALNHFDRMVGHIDVLITGEARGLDQLAGSWFLGKGRPVIDMKAAWDAHKKAAGPIRNHWMLTYGMPTHVLAFRGGVGTADMVTKARKKGLPVWRVRPNPWGLDLTPVGD